ncbi:unnamed protein product [Lactuca virosa]|uniref:Ubiquitin conjugation factor E4 core domain-containing protein n=1 Tax=Lactuca virosa TaxID=75947 RepID=A0AAU9PKZ4_9ASTR|nr:unnamed protein product [Lactuca virosa]
MPFKNTSRSRLLLSSVDCFTSSGRTARFITKYKPPMPVISVLIPPFKTNQLRGTFTGAFAEVSTEKSISNESAKKRKKPCRSSLRADILGGGGRRLPQGTGQEMSVVVGCFNERAQKVLDVHLATGFHKYFMWCKGKLHGNHHSLIQEDKDLVAYAVINAIAMHKILKKYDKVDPIFSASSWMFANLSVVMLRLCEPFVDTNSTKKDKIDPKYVFYGSRLDFNGSSSATSTLFEGHQLSVQYPVKNLLKLYVDIEFTGSPYI